MKDPQKVLIIDDDLDMCEFVSSSAQAMGFNCASTSDAVAFLDALTPDTALIMLDLVMPGMDGIELLRLLGQMQCKAGIVLMSGVGKRIVETAEDLAKSLGLSVVGSLQKPFRLAELELVLGLYAAPDMKPVYAERPAVITLEDDLRLAIEQDLFLLHYQPQIDIATGSVIGVEALVRWQHPERGLIYPDDFIGRAEELGLIDRLGWLTADRGLSEVGQFSGKTGSLLMLSLNVSSQSLHDLKFPDTLVSLAIKHAIPADKITLEITESGLLENLSSTLDVLTRLRMKQVQLSVDDFGTGYSMMQQLRNIPATELKIDRSFVQNMHATQSDRVMVQKTIEIGHELGMKVVAEGVETAEQLEFLRANGCDSAQGYFFSRPLPPTALLAWLDKYRA